MHSLQDAIALIAVILATAFLLHRVWRLFFQPIRGCGGCTTCPTASQETRTVITIAPLPSADGK